MELHCWLGGADLLQHGNVWKFIGPWNPVSKDLCMAEKYISQNKNVKYWEKSGAILFLRFGYRASTAMYSLDVKQHFSVYQRKYKLVNHLVK